MRVNLKLGQPLCQSVGAREVVVDVTPPVTVGDALYALAVTYPQAGHELRLGTDRSDFYYSLFVNDRLVLFADKDSTSLHDGDTVSVLLPLAGG